MQKHTTKYKPARTILRNEIHHVKGALSLAAKDVKRNVKRRSAILQNKMSKSINKKPLQTLGLVAVSGFILGLIAKKNSNHRSE